MGTATTMHLDLKMNQNPTFDVNKGFTYKRKQRPVTTSPDQLSSAKIPQKFRDYCADKLLVYQVCRYKHFPVIINCAHEKHDYLTCEMKDYVIRMKEFERERRLRERERRLKKGGGGKCPPPNPDAKPCAEKK